MTAGDKSSSCMIMSRLLFSMTIHRVSYANLGQHHIQWHQISVFDCGRFTFNIEDFQCKTYTEIIIWLWLLPSRIHWLCHACHTCHVVQLSLTMTNIILEMYAYSHTFPNTQILKIQSMWTWHQIHTSYFKLSHPLHCWFECSAVSGWHQGDMSTRQSHRLNWFRSFVLQSHGSQ